MTMPAQAWAALSHHHLAMHLSLQLQTANEADLINPGSPAGLVCQSSGEQDVDEGRLGEEAEGKRAKTRGWWSVRSHLRALCFSPLKALHN